MTAFKNYLLYRIKKSALRTVIISFCSLVMAVYTVDVCNAHMYTGDGKYNGETGIYMLATILGILATVIPIMETAEFKNRRNLDTLYFLPISRMGLATAHYVSGLFQVICAYTVSFLGMSLALLEYNQRYALRHLLLYYILSVVIGALMYSFFIFVFTQANTVVDGIAFCFLWICGIWLVLTVSITSVIRMFALDVEISAASERINSLLQWTNVYMPINNLTMIFQNMIEDRSDSFYFIRQINEINNSFYMFFVWSAACIACGFGYFITFVRKGAEKAGEISDSIFGYKLFIPLCGFAILVENRFRFDFLSIFVLIAILVGYTVYRRSAKLKKSDIIILFAALVLLLINSYVL